MESSPVQIWRRLFVSAAALALINLPGATCAQLQADHAILADPSGEPIIIGSAHKITSTVYGETKFLTVRLPRSYTDNADQRYPVVFSINGGPEQDFELLAGIAAEAELLTSFEPFRALSDQSGSL
jgi:hypothetical protein